MREILNVDMPKLKQEAVEEAKRNGRFDIAADLRLWRLGVDRLETKSSLTRRLASSLFDELKKKKRRENELMSAAFDAHPLFFSSSVFLRHWQPPQRGFLKV
jgi:hypothetical protein